MTKIKIALTPSTGEDVDKTNDSYTAMGTYPKKLKFMLMQKNADKCS